MTLATASRIIIAATFPLAALLAPQSAAGLNISTSAAIHGPGWDFWRDRAGPRDVLDYADAAPGQRASAAPLAEKSKPAPPSEWVSDGRAMRPLLSRSRMAAFEAPLSAAVDMGRLTQLRRAMADHAKTRPAGWQALVAGAKEAWRAGGDAALFLAVEAIVNEIPYVDGTDGTFFSPARLFGRGGVCKDFATAKYILLRDAGFPAARLRIAVVTPRGPSSEWHVLLLAVADGADDPVALDLVPSRRAAESLAKAGYSKTSKVKEIKLKGIDLARVDYSSPGQSMAALSKLGPAHYSGGLRSLDWVGNEEGGAAFAKPLPSKRVNGRAPRFVRDSGGQMWKLGGTGPFATLSSDAFGLPTAPPKTILAAR